jgi:N-acetylglutamate synthase-like GNAT family acetyltransferase
MSISIEAFCDVYRAQVLALSLRAWSPVFEKLKPAVQPFVYEAFYPTGWEARQTADIDQFLETEAANIWVAFSDNELVGWIGLRLHQDDQMGEIYILAVDPANQQKGIATALMEKGFAQIKAAGMTMVMVETGDDPGHSASRAAYERVGFTRWPVARYFRQL